MLFRHIAIVGVGLIGGSFALAVRRAGVCERITGWDREDVLERALARRVIDGVESAFGSGDVSEADLVYLAAPVGAILSFLRTRAGSLKPGAILVLQGMSMLGLVRFDLLLWFAIYLVAHVVMLCTFAAALGAACNSPSSNGNHTTSTARIRVMSFPHQS